MLDSCADPPAKVATQRQRGAGRGSGGSGGGGGGGDDGGSGCEECTALDNTMARDALFPVSWPPGTDAS